MRQDCGVGVAVAVGVAVRVGVAVALPGGVVAVAVAVGLPPPAVADGVTVPGVVVAFCGQLPPAEYEASTTTHTVWLPLRATATPAHFTGTDADPGM